MNEDNPTKNTSYDLAINMAKIRDKTRSDNLSQTIKKSDIPSPEISQSEQIKTAIKNFVGKYF